MKPEKQLYQWDVNQYLTELQPTAEFVDYPMGNEVIRIKADGTRCRIPDEVLQTYGGKTCYERYPDGTFRAYSFNVLYAPKPPDYVFTPEERTTFEALTARVDAAIEDIKRRADSGEFTPKKGVDYFTESDKNELMEGVSSGAVGEFRKVVDSATTEYNDNASEKLTTYDTNAEQHTTDYNRNAAEKLEAYNSNHTAKVAEYNQNAETKTAEFDANAAALQTEVNRLRGECDTLAAEKANVDGYYEEMTVGDAEQLVATQFVEDNKPYLLRPTGGSSDVGNRAYLDKIVGGTVAWNQLAQNFVANNSYGFERCTGAFNDGVATLTVDADGATAGRATIYNSDATKVSAPIATHKYFLTCCIKPSIAVDYVKVVFGNGNSIRKDGLTASAWNLVEGMSTYGTPSGNYVQVDVFGTLPVGDTAQVKNLMVIDLTQMFGSTIADYIYSIEQSQAGAGVAWFKKLFPKDYYEYNAGELLSVEGLQSHDAVGFNQWDEEWENGTILSNGTLHDNPICIRSKNYNHCIGGATYYLHCGSATSIYFMRLIFYDANKNRTSDEANWTTNTTVIAPSNACYFKIATQDADGVTYGGTYNHDICINLSDPSRNGEYEPYDKHSYPLDSSITLRGIPKLDASNNLYYDGDEYTSDGKVKRKYGVVTFDGSNDERWSKLGSSSASAYAMQIEIDGKIIQTSNRMTILCDKLVTVLPLDTWGNYSQFIAPVFGKDMIAAGISTITTIKDWRTYLASNPITVLFELATPTTETAEPFHNIQIVDDFGTEEFVSTGIVPVGHKTRYPANLRDKLQHLPSLANADGTYIIQQSGKQMSLIHMPAVFPETPTEDGTYTLKTVVTGGVATLQWVAE